MTMPINLKSSIPSDKVDNDEQGMARSPVLPTKATDGAVESNNESLHSNKDLSMKEPAKTAHSGHTKVNLSPTLSKKQKKLCKFFEQFFAVKTVLFCC
jgi:hypothetical protein